MRFIAKLPFVVSFGIRIFEVAAMRVAAEAAVKAVASRSVSALTISCRYLLQYAAARGL